MSMLNLKSVLLHCANHSRNNIEVLAANEGVNLPSAQYNAHPRMPLVGCGSNSGILHPVWHVCNPAHGPSTRTHWHLTIVCCDTVSIQPGAQPVFHVSYMGVLDDAERRLLSISWQERKFSSRTCSLAISRRFLNIRILSEEQKQGKVNRTALLDTIVYKHRVVRIGRSKVLTCFQLG